MGRTENQFSALALGGGFPLERANVLDWLTPRGHRASPVERGTPAHVVAALADIFARLGGDERALVAKKGGTCRPDFVLHERRLIIEVDEIQHFTSARLATFDLYPPST